MSITLERLRTHVVTRAAIEPARIARWHQELAARDGDALASRWVRDDEWLLIRRLPVRVRWRIDDADGDVGRAWNDGLTRAIDEALAGDDGNCVRYPNHRAALADLVYRSALNDSGRQWAWRSMGLLEHADVSCDEALGAGVARLARTPELVWPVLMRLVEGEGPGASWTATLRALPAAAWTRLLDASPRTAPYARIAREVAATASATLPQEPEPSPAPGPTPTSAPTAPPQTTSSPAARALEDWAAARPYFAQSHVQTLSVLLAAIAFPPEGVPTRALRQRLAAARTSLVRRLSEAKRPHLSAVPPPRPLETSVERSAGRRDERPAEPTSSPPQRGSLRDGAAATRLPELSEPDDGRLTRYGGALFWLGRVGASGELKLLADADDAPDDALRLFLRELVRALGVPDDDEARSAFCGGHLPEAPAPASLVARAEALAARWSAWLDEAAPDLPEPRMTSVCRREGRLFVEPGWIELHLPLGGVDSAIRRLGLDLDPGWLPWLGCAVRICYDV